MLNYLVALDRPLEERLIKAVRQLDPRALEHPSASRTSDWILTEIDSLISDLSLMPARGDEGTLAAGVMAMNHDEQVALAQRIAALAVDVEWCIGKADPTV